MGDDRRETRATVKATAGKILRRITLRRADGESIDIDVLGGRQYRADLAAQINDLLEGREVNTIQEVD